MPESIGSTLTTSMTMTLRPNTKEEKIAAVQVVCGAEACQGKEDAIVILEALGLIKPKGTSHV
jgi:hypothetical protein